MLELHLDIIEEILAARSQVDDLIRCKRVCKSWNSLISSHRFVKSHLNYNLKKTADNNEIGDTRIFLNDGGYGCYHLVGSSNGLVCIYFRLDRDFFVVNPSTREVKELRNPPQDIGIEVYFGFGYDSSIDDFKVVMGIYDENSDNFVFNLLTLKSNVWRTVAAGEVRDYPEVKDKYGTLCNGVIHWLCSKQIVSFDLSKEVFIEIPRPDPQCDRLKAHKYTVTLGTIKDRLCIIYNPIYTWFKKTEEIEIWVVKNYNVMKTEGIESERWLPPPGYDEHKTIMNYTQHESLLNGHVNIWMLEEGAGATLLVHSIEGCPPGRNAHHIKLSTISEGNFNFALPVFIKSLVSPHGMGDDIRCKRVCKSWNSLISSHRFVKSHLNYNLKKKADNNEIGDTRIDLNDGGYGCYHLVGSSNGLVCIHFRLDREFFVVNPSTREVKELRNPPQDIGIEVYFGFGYDSSIDDFKVVMGIYDKNSDNFVFNLLTLKSNVWRTVAAGEVRDYPEVKDKYGTLCNGVIHWLCSKQIVSFDLSKEAFIEIPRPDHQCDRLKAHKYTVTLGTIKDRLCIIYNPIYTWFKKTEEIEIWVVKNYNVMKTEGIEFERWLPPPGYDEHKTIMNYTPHESFLNGHVNIWMLEEGAGAPLLVHSIEGPPGRNAHHIKLSTISECNFNFALPVFIKSLVSPHGMGDDDSGNGGRLESNGMLQESSGAAVFVHKVRGKK